MQNHKYCKLDAIITSLPFYYRIDQYVSYIEKLGFLDIYKFFVVKRQFLLQRFTKISKWNINTIISFFCSCFSQDIVSSLPSIPIYDGIQKHSKAIYICPHSQR